jgi:hypothetical protein
MLAAEKPFALAQGVQLWFLRNGWRHSGSSSERKTGNLRLSACRRPTQLATAYWRRGEDSPHAPTVWHLSFLQERSHRLPILFPLWCVHSPKEHLDALHSPDSHTPLRRSFEKADSSGSSPTHIWGSRLAREKNPWRCEDQILVNSSKVPATRPSKELGVPAFYQDSSTIVWWMTCICLDNACWTDGETYPHLRARTWRHCTPMSNFNLAEWILDCQKRTMYVLMEPCDGMVLLIIHLDSQLH